MAAVSRDGEPMTIRVELLEAERLRVVSLEGSLSDPDLYEAFSALWLAPDYDPGLDELVDLTGVTGVGVTAAGLRRLADTSEALHRGTPAVRVAIVAPDNLLYGLSRMYEGFASASPSEHRVFRSFGDARAWLKEG
jgi:hypothetical protein